MNMNQVGRTRLEVFLEQLLLLFVLFVGGAMAGLFGLIVDQSLLGHGVSVFTVLFASHALCGLLLCSLYWHKRVWAQEEMEILNDRQNKVALMNHYVGNAMAVLAFYSRENQHKEAQEAVEEAVRKIEWALTDVLPCGWNIDHLIAKPVRRETVDVNSLAVTAPGVEPRRAG